MRKPTWLVPSPSSCGCRALGRYRAQNVGAQAFWRRIIGRYTGGHFYLVGLKSRGGGRVAVRVDGRRRVFNTRARRTRHRRVLGVVRAKVAPHRVRVRVLRGQVAIDAVGSYRRGR